VGAATKLAGDERHPPDAEAHAHAGEDVRHRTRQHDRHEQFPGARAEAQAGAHEIRIDVACAGHRIEHDREECREKDDVDDLRVADAEPQNGKWNPRERRNRPDELEQRVDRRAKAREPAHRETQRNANDARRPHGKQHSLEAVEDVRQQYAALDQIDGGRKHRGGWRQHHVELRVEAQAEDAHALPHDDERDEQPEVLDLCDHPPPRRRRRRHHRDSELREGSRIGSALARWGDRRNRRRRRGRTGDFRRGAERAPPLRKHAIPCLIHRRRVRRCTSCP
jgi:hypothetical protein